MRDLPSISMAEWLAGIGLSKYFAVFADNGLGLDVMADVTDADLATMGVLLGDRKRLLRAIAELQAEPSGPAQSAGQPPARESSRRHLTVLFCDLVGSMPLSHRLDPEDLERVISDFQRVSTASIARNGGYIARFMGDGILAYFGYPQAHENDAESATRAGLDLVARTRKLRTPEGEALRVRVGIATGLVLAMGEAIGVGESREQSVVGKTPNLAARLQALAEPDTVLVSERTRELLGDLMFTCEDMGLQHVKGLDDPVRAWRVVDERRSPSRFDARRAARITPLVGRGPELNRLLALWETARQGEGRVALLSGEAGMGKSRLCRALLDQTSDDPHYLIRYQCSPHHAQSPLQPVISQLEHAARFERDDDADARLDKLAALVAESGAGGEAELALLAALLAIPAEHRYTLPQLNSQNQRKRTIEALVQQVLALAGRKPVLLVMEDLHWVDPTTLELLTLCLERARTVPLLALLTCRPEFAPEWPRAQVTRFAIGRLDDAQVLAMIEALTAGRDLPSAVSSQIVSRTDGVPLFVEELTKSVVESGLLRESAGRLEVAGPLPALAIPGTLQETLMARLDRLGSVREVAQVAAALGREFSFRLLGKVTGLADGELAPLLLQLCNADMIHEVGSPPDARYIFKHSLVQGAAYETLLRARRLGLHARIAEVLRDNFDDVARLQPELVAHHFTEAQLPDQAIAWWKRAGLSNVKRSANSEAVVHFGRCLALLAGLPQAAERDRRELEIRIAFSVPLMGTSGYTSPEFRANTDKALEICESLGDDERIYPVLWGLIARSFSSGDVKSARVLAQRFLDSADRQDNRQLRMIGHRLCGMTLFGAGELQGALAHLERSLELYDAATDEPLAYVYGADQRVAALAYLGRTLLLLGDAEGGVRAAEQALLEAQRIEHANTTIYAQGCLLELHMLRREHGVLLNKATEVSSLANGHAARNYQLVALVAERIEALPDRGTEVLGEIDCGLDELLALDWIYWVTRLALLAAEVGAAAGHAAWARAWLDRARELIDRLGQGVCVPELHHVEAEVLRAEGAPDERVHAALVRAVAAGRAQSARWPEQRSAALLARLVGGAAGDPSLGGHQAPLLQSFPIQV